MKCSRGGKSARNRIFFIDIRIDPLVDHRYSRTFHIELFHGSKVMGNDIGKNLWASRINGTEWRMPEVIQPGLECTGAR